MIITEAEYCESYLIQLSCRKSCVVVGTNPLSDRFSRRNGVNRRSGNDVLVSDGSDVSNKWNFDNCYLIYSIHKVIWKAFLDIV